jgi:hypothetical protein
MSPLRLEAQRMNPPDNASKEIDMTPTNTVDYSRYQTFNITCRGPNNSVIDLQMKVSGNGKLPTAGHEG